MKIYSPSNIKVLLHYHTTPAPHPRIDAPAVAEATYLFLDNGCIQACETNKDQYRTTPKGKAWVNLLCEVEMPREAFVDKDGNLIEFK